MADNLKAILGAGVVNSTPLFDALVDSQWVLDIGSNSGDQLDISGDFLQERRNQLTDNDYRERLLQKIEVLKGHGSRDDIIKAVKLLTGAEAVQLVEGLASVTIGINDPITLELVGQIKEYVGGGISLSGVTISDTPFMFAGGDGLGFGTVGDPSVGGDLASYLI